MRFSHRSVCVFHLLIESAVASSVSMSSVCVCVCIHELRDSVLVLLGKIPNEIRIFQRIWYSMISIPHVFFCALIPQVAGKLSNIQGHHISHSSNLAAPQNYRSEGILVVLVMCVCHSICTHHFHPSRPSPYLTMCVHSK